MCAESVAVAARNLGLRGVFYLFFVCFYTICMLLYQLVVVMIGVCHS